MSLNLDKSTWKLATFGEVARNVNDTVRDPESSGVHRVIAMEHLDPGELKIARMGSSEDGTTFTRVVKPGQTLFGKRRAYQRKVAYADFEAICSGDIYTFEARETRLLPELLPFLVQSNEFFDHALETSAGSLSPRTNWRDLANFEFGLPPLDEQKRIADLLWAVERERISVATITKVIDRVRSTTRNELFGSVVAPSVRFDSFCSIPSQNGVTLKKSERAGDVPMVNMGEMFRGEVISTASDYERVTAPDDRFLLAQNDLLFARRSIVFEGAGACCLVPRLSEPYTFESSVIRTRVLAGAADSRYVLHFFRSDRGRNVMSTIVRRGPVSGIAGSDLRTLQLPLPDLASQQQIVETIDQAGSVAPYLHDRIQSANGLKTALLAAIFGGS